MRIVNSGLFTLLLALGLVLGLSSCDSYNKVLKSTDLNYKYEMAKKYYNKGQYYRAQPLLEELLGVYRGTERAEDVYYYYAYCELNQANYTAASYHFKNFAQSFPRSAKAEETEFMSAYALSLESPEYSLDPTSTEKAIEGLQYFINRYPNSEKVKECNETMDRLRRKLEIKAFRSASLYYKMEDYRASAILFKNILVQYPDIDEREEVAFLVVKSFYLLAKNSIESKKKERFEEVVKAFQNFKEEFPRSPWMKEAEDYLRLTHEALVKIEKSTVHSVPPQSNSNP